MGESGQSIVEYVLVILLISLVLILAVTGQGGNTIYDGLRQVAERAGTRIMELIGG